MDRKLFNSLPLSCFLFFHFHFLSSLPASCQQHLGKQRISQSLFLTKNGLQLFRPHSLWRHHANLLWKLQHSSVLLELPVNDFRRLKAIMVFVLFCICWLSRKSCYSAVRPGVKREPTSRRGQLLYSCIAVSELFLNSHRSFATQPTQGWWEHTGNEPSSG